MAEHADPAGELTLLLDADVVDIEDYDAECAADDVGAAPGPPANEPMSTARRAVLLALGGRRRIGDSGGMVGISRLPVGGSATTQRSHFLQVARQGALNLTTIDWQKAEGDVQRILDGATGQFHDDFAKRTRLPGHSGGNGGDQSSVGDQRC